MGQLSCVVYARASEERQLLAGNIEATGHASILESVGVPSDLGEAALLEGVDAIFCVLDEGAQLALGALANASRARPPIVLVGPGGQSGLLPAIMQLGPRAYLPRWPDVAAVAEVVERLVLQPAGPAGNDSRLVSVLGVKGGVGSTAVSAQLAAALDGSVCVVDLDLHGGDVALHYDLRPTATIADISRRPARLDAAYARGLTTLHSSGVSVLAAPRNLEDVDRIELPHVQRCLRLLRHSFDWIVADLPRHLDDIAMRTLALSDLLVVVLVLDLPGVSHARRTLERLAGLGVPADRIRIVANRCSRGDRLSLREAQDFLHRPLDARLPNDREAMMRSLHTGRPLCAGRTRGDLRMAFEDLALSVHGWCDVPVAEARVERPSRLSRLIRRVV